MPKQNSGIINTGSIGGNASVEHLREHVGDSNRIHADNSTVTIKGQVAGIEQPIGEVAGITPRERAELVKSVRDLLARVGRLPPELADHRDRIVDAVDIVSKELSRPKRSGTFLTDAWGMLKSSVVTVAGVAPEAIQLLNGIAKIVGMAVVP
jgi:hypothetical protein